MTRAQILLAMIPAGYLIGSIPFGLLVGLAKGIDPRKAGSGNIGATNVGRLLGGKYFALVFALDLLKGAIPTLLAGAVLHFSAPDQTSYLLWIAVGFAAIFGHIYSIFLGFKGGKGVATSTGVLLGIFPYFTISGFFAIATWLVVFGLTRTVSLGSMIGSAAFTVAYIVIGTTRGWDITGAQLPLLIFSILVPSMIIYKHRTNIARLLAGTETRVGQSR
jgi:glycerol-3-phosphate acyltransferase PlsY